MSVGVLGVRSPTAISRLAREGGLAAGLGAALAQTGPVPCSRRGRTLLPAGWGQLVDCWQPAGAAGAHGSCASVVLPHPVAAAEGLELIEVTLAGPIALTATTGPAARWSARLIAVRVGLTDRMLGLAVGHLAGRESDGAPLTSLQLVQGAIADVTSCLEICRHGLEVIDSEPPGPAQAFDWMHDRLDRADLAISGMFGAAGYLADHPVRCLRLVALLRDLWTEPAARATGEGGRE